MDIFEEYSKNKLLEKLVDERQNNEDTQNMNSFCIIKFNRYELLCQFAVKVSKCLLPILVLL